MALRKHTTEEEKTMTAKSQWELDQEWKEQKRAKRIAARDKKRAEKKAKKTGKPIPKAKKEEVLPPMLEHARHWKWNNILGGLTKTLSTLTDKGSYQIITSMRDTYPVIKYIDKELKVTELPMQGRALTYEGLYEIAYNIVDKHYRELK